MGATDDADENIDEGAAYLFDITDTCYTFLLPDNEWRQVSLPGNPGEENSVAAIFGDDIPGTYGTDWIVYIYDTASNLYINPGLDGIISQGQGLWILQTTGSDVILDMPDGTDPTPVSHPAACPEDAGCFIVPLTGNGSVQWNMAGYPFCASGDVDNFRVTTLASTPVHDCSDGDGCTLTEAREAGVLHDVFWHYVDEATGYSAVQPGDFLSPWDGFWAAALENSGTSGTSLLIPASP